MRKAPDAGAKLGRAARLVTRGDASWFRAPALALADADLEHGVTHASHGNFSLSRGEDPEVVGERRRAFLEDAGLGDARLLAPKLHHSADVGVVRGGRAPEGIVDALVARENSLVLAVTVADCVPVFFVDPVTGAFGVAHAGWRGVAGGIVRNAIEALKQSFDVAPEDLFVAAGPSIRGPSYEVGPEVAGLFPEEFAVPSATAAGAGLAGGAAPGASGGGPGAGAALAGNGGADRFLLDLPSCVLAEARAAGVPRDNLVDFALCTSSHPGDLFSHRRGDNERHWAFIGRP
jgi:YfiH family protein